MASSPIVEVSVIKVTPFLREDRPLLWLGERHAERPRLLGIAIGEFEAAAIQMPLDGERPVRPISYDLLQAMLGPLNITVEQVVIHAARRSTFFAKLVVSWDQTIREVDARPSDAVALALRLGAPIFVAAELLDRLALVPAADDIDIEQTLNRFMETEPQVQAVAPVGLAEPAATAGHGGAPRPDVPGKSPAPAGNTAMEGPVDALAQLQVRLERAIVCEDYEEAARLRDEIGMLGNRGKA